MCWGWGCSLIRVISNKALSLNHLYDQLMFLELTLDLMPICMDECVITGLLQATEILSGGHFYFPAVQPRSECCTVSIALIRNPGNENQGVSGNGLHP